MEENKNGKGKGGKHFERKVLVLRRRKQRKKMRKIAEKEDIWSAEEKTNGNEKEENWT